MEGKRSSPRHFPIFPLLALAVILLGLLAMSSASTQSQRLLLESQDGQLAKTAQSVDNNIMGHFAWYCSDLEYITSRTAFLSAERTYLSGGGADDLLYHLRESPLPKTVMVESMLVLRHGSVALSTSGETDQVSLAVLGRIGEVSIELWLDGAGRPYVALVRSKPEVGYAALIDGEVFFAIAEKQTAAEDHDRILVLDSQERYFFHRTQEGIRIDAVEGLAPPVHASLHIMLEAQRGGRPLSSFFRAGAQSGGESYTARLAVLPAPGNENGCFTVGVARNYDQIIRPYQSAAVQMVLCGVTVMAGTALMLASLLRSRRSHRQAQEELALLREKAQAMEQLNAQTQALAHRQRLETIGTLTSGIAHEFNNLLTPIMGYSILILEKLPPEDAESYDNALEIYNASQKAKNIVARLSNLSRKGAPGALRPVRLDPLVGQVLEVAAPARPKAVRVETGLAAQAPPDPGGRDPVVPAYAEPGAQLLRGPGPAGRDGAGIHRLGWGTGVPACGGQWSGHPGGGKRTHLRPLFHHQGLGQGHRPGPGHRAADRRGPWRLHRPGQRRRTGHRFHRLLPRRPTGCREGPARLTKAPPGSRRGFSSFLTNIKVLSMCH